MDLFLARAAGGGVLLGIRSLLGPSPARCALPPNSGAPGGAPCPGQLGGEEARWGCSLGKPRLPAAAAAARCHPRLEERTAGPALPGGALVAAASAPRVGALRVVCEGWEPCLAPPEGHTATLSAHREGCSLPRCSHASFGSPQPRRAAGSKQNLRLRVGRSTRIKARFPFLFYFVQKRCN